MRFLRRRKKPSPPVLDPPGYLGAVRVGPPPPPPPLMVPRVDANPLKPGMKLMMSDGTMQDLPDDPELAARAQYLIKSMLPPAPPPPPIPG